MRIRFETSSCNPGKQDHDCVTKTLLPAAVPMRFAPKGRLGAGGQGVCSSWGGHEMKYEVVLLVFLVWFLPLMHPQAANNPVLPTCFPFFVCTGAQLESLQSTVISAGIGGTVRAWPRMWQRGGKSWFTCMSSLAVKRVLCHLRVPISCSFMSCHVRNAFVVVIGFVWSCHGILAWRLRPPVSSGSFGNLSRTICLWGFSQPYLGCCRARYPACLPYSTDVSSGSPL